MEIKSYWYLVNINGEPYKYTNIFGEKEILKCNTIEEIEREGDYLGLLDEYEPKFLKESWWW